MALTIITPPTAEPVSMAHAKAHLRVDHDDDDTLIAGIIAAARGYCERFCRRSFAPATLRLTLDRFPPSAVDASQPRSRRAIVLPYPPLVSVSSITYVDTAGVTQTLAADRYTVDDQSAPARLVPAYSLVWPTTRGHVNDVAITYLAGTSTAPPPVLQAMLLLIGHWYENREAVLTGTISTTLDLAVESLLWSERSEV